MKSNLVSQYGAKLVDTELCTRRERGEVSILQVVPYFYLLKHRTVVQFEAR